MSQIKTAHELNEQGIERFNQGDYVHAAALFEQAAQMATISKSVYVCNLGDAYARMNDWEEAIFQAKVALQHDPDYDRAKKLLARWLFDYGQALHREQKFYEARYCYAEALIYNPTEEFWHNELRKTVLPPAILPEITLVNFPDTWNDLVRLFTNTLLYFFQEIQKPVKLFWATEDIRSDLPLQQIPGVAHSLPDYQGQSIFCHNIVLNAEHYKDATIIEVMGDMVHELAHEAWKARDADNVRFLPPFTTNDFTHSTNEWITDLQVLYRGFGTWLLKSREYMQKRHMFSFTEQYRAMKPIEIRRRLRAVWDYRGQQTINLGADKKKKGEQDDAIKAFRKAERIWQRAVAEDPAYAYAHYQLAVIYGWLDDWQQAFTHGSTAALLEPSNNQFAKYLQEVIDRLIGTSESLENQKNNASSLMKKATSLWATNQAEAQQSFLQAIERWQSLLETVPLYAFALHEIGVAYHWLGDNEKAVEYTRLATTLMPTHYFYYASLADIYNKVQQHELAVSAAKSAVACNPKDARSHAILGKSYWYKGDLIRAEQSLQKAVEFDPDNQRYLEDLRNLREQLHN